jgi:hypothetical protein
MVLAVFQGGDPLLQWLDEADDPNSLETDDLEPGKMPSVCEHH